MLHTRFQIPEPSGSKVEDFEYFLCISVVQTHDRLALDHCRPGGHHLTKLGKGPPGHAINPVSSI